jgi:hypothetical protein
LAKQLHLLEDPCAPYYEYEPQVVLENDKYKLYLDLNLVTDKTVHFNRPDITLADKTNKEAALIGIAIPLTLSLQATITDKQNKYLELAFESRQQWQLNKIIFIPFALPATGVVLIMLNQSLTTLNLKPHLLSEVQKVDVINICSVVRKFLRGGVHLT